MRAKGTVWAFFLAIMLSGCLGSQPDTGEQEPVATPAPVETPAPGPQQNVTPTDVAPQPRSMSYAQQGCNSLVIVDAVSFAEANALLPLGFVAADAGYLLGLPANINQALIGLAAIACEGDDLGTGPFVQAQATVFIDAPAAQGPGAPAAATTINAYELARWTSSPAQLANLTEFGWAAYGGLEALVENESPEPVAGALEGTAIGVRSEGTINGTEAWNGNAGGAYPYEIANTPFRYWHAGDVGLSYIELSVTKDGLVGASQCTFGGDMARTLQREDCGTTGFSIIFENVDIAIELHHLPEAYV